MHKLYSAQRKSEFENMLKKGLPAYVKVLSQKRAWGRAIPIQTNSHCHNLFTIFIYSCYSFSVWVSSVQSISPYPIYLRITVFIFFHMWIVFQIGLFWSVLTNIICLFPLRAAYSVHPSLIILGEEYKLWNSELYNYLHSPITYHFLGINIMFS